MWSGSGCVTTGVGADQANTELGGHVSKCWISSAPRIVEHIGPCLTNLFTDFVAPGVHTDNDRVVPLSNSFNETDGAPDLFSGINLNTGSSFDATDVDDVCAFIDGSINRIHRGFVIKSGALVVERVGSAIDDGHDD
ncbi:unannotated protein [freshwater metagenome]|uniref:Unannotated protein n=1 Tax=freshwater metagenome TaxID=449393 RepID=A0A6J7EBF9_9ZZZZ